MIYIAKPFIDKSVARNVNDAVNSGYISPIGPFVAEFEGLFGRYFKRHASSCSSGTAALHLALRALGVEPGDEVIVPNMTFVAVPNAVTYCGATPVLCDIESETLGIDYEEFKNAISKRTKAVIVVHLYGKAARDIRKIQRLCDSLGIFMIEDCAEAIGAIDIAGDMTGTFGDAACFSFYGNKVISTGQGGMVISKEHAVIDNVNLLKNQAMLNSGDYGHCEVGYNYRMTNIEAAIGCAQFKKLNKILQKRMKNAELYGEMLGIRVNPLDSHWVFPVKTKKPVPKNSIFEFREAFVPLNLLPMYRSEKDFIVSRETFENFIILPNHTYLKSSDIKKICNFLKEYL